MPRQHNTNSAALRSIKAKRASVSPKRLRARHEAGEDIDGQRAIVRMGQMNTRILTGLEDLSTWDDEELARGQRKSIKTGRFSGPAPVIVPIALHNELVKRRMAEAQKLLREAVVPACQQLAAIVEGEDVEDKDKLKAIAMILDRVMGKAPERVEMTVTESKMQQAFKAMLVPDDDDTIDVESWEE